MANDWIVNPTPPTPERPVKRSFVPTVAIVVIAALVAVGIWSFRARPVAQGGRQLAEAPARDIFPASRHDARTSLPSVRSSGRGAQNLHPGRRPGQPAGVRQSEGDREAATADAHSAPGVKPDVIDLASAASPVPAAAGAPTVDPRVYDTSDIDVAPPRLVSPPMSFPWAAVASGPTGAGFEVVVNEQGRVDSVKTNTRPRTVGETMLIFNRLSAAKTWRFDPAEKDAHPVRYRLFVPIDKL